MRYTHKAEWASHGLPGGDQAWTTLPVRRCAWLRGGDEDYDGAQTERPSKKSGRRLWSNVDGSKGLDSVEGPRDQGDNIVMIGSVPHSRNPRQVRRARIRQRGQGDYAQ